MLKILFKKKKPRQEQKQTTKTYKQSNIYVYILRRHQTLLRVSYCFTNICLYCELLHLKIECETFEYMSLRVEFVLREKKKSERKTTTGWIIDSTLCAKMSQYFYFGFESQTIQHWNGVSTVKRHKNKWCNFYGLNIFAFIYCVMIESIENINVLYVDRWLLRENTSKSDQRNCFFFPSKNVKI